ncbi:MAG: hypothetical protein J6B55_03695 [Clostridia bacterium]|nr:hypothetical protein [Clostridia bacterium]
MEDKKQCIAKITVIEADGTVKTYEGESFFTFAAKVNEDGLSVRGEVVINAREEERISFYVAILRELQRLGKADELFPLVRKMFDKGVFDLEERVVLCSTEVVECSED